LILDIKDVKQELSSDEKLLESAFKLESIYKKYKYAIWGVAGALIIAYAGSQISTYLENSRLEAANTALLSLQQNPDDTKALATLKDKNPSLYEIYMYSKAANSGDTKELQTLQNSSNDIVADGSKYTLSVLQNAPKDSKLYHELALLQQAYLAIKKGDKDTAKVKLSLIDQNSQVANIAKLLQHATIKVK
jgi:hypothetical protein